MNQYLGRYGPDEIPYLALVLEPGNIHRLSTYGEPIKVRIGDWFPDGLIPSRLEIIISYTETPVQDGREVKQHSEIGFDERTPVAQKMRPHCPECKSTMEQFGLIKNNSPVALICCPSCGCVLGAVLNEGLVTNITKE